MSVDILWRGFHILTEPVPYTLACVNRRNNETPGPHCNVGPGFRYINVRNQFRSNTDTRHNVSVDIRIFLQCRFLWSRAQCRRGIDNCLLCVDNAPFAALQRCSRCRCCCCCCNQHSTAVMHQHNVDSNSWQMQFLSARALSTRPQFIYKTPMARRRPFLQSIYSC